MKSLFRRALPVFYLLSPLIPLAFYFRYNWYSFFHLYSLSVAAGVVGYVYFLNQFITGGRLKVFDRLYGYDRVLLFHRYTAILGFALLVFHHETKDVAEDLQVRLGAAALVLFSLLIVFALLFLSNALSHVSIFARLRAFVQRKLRLQYQHFLFIHNLTAVAMLLALAHVLLAGSTRESPYRFAVMLLWYCGATGTYVWYKFIRPRVHKRYPFRVTRVVQEVRGIATLELSMPDGAGTGTGSSSGRDGKRGNRKQFTYQPGQFCFMRFLTGEMSREEHPYSISSAPHNRAGITITAKDCGDWSGVLAKRVAVGDCVAVDGAYGLFSHTRLARKEAEVPLVFVAGGVGVTPFMSMLSALAYEKSQRSILLIWKVRAEEELFLKSRITAWEKSIPQLRTAFFVSASQEGRITISDMCLSSLTEMDIEVGCYFLCGPLRMVRDCRRYLRQRGVAGRRVHNENFGF